MEIKMRYSEYKRPAGTISSKCEQAVCVAVQSAANAARTAFMQRSDFDCDPYDLCAFAIFRLNGA